MSTKLRAVLGAGAVALVAVAFLVARLDVEGPGGGWMPAAEASRHVGERGTVCGEGAATRASGGRGDRLLRYPGDRILAM